MKLKEKLLIVGVSVTLAASIVYDAVGMLEGSDSSFPDSAQAFNGFDGDSGLLANEGEPSAIQLTSRQLSGY